MIINKTGHTAYTQHRQDKAVINVSSPVKTYTMENSALPVSFGYCRLLSKEEKFRQRVGTILDRNRDTTGGYNSTRIGLEELCEQDLYPDVQRQLIWFAADSKEQGWKRAKAINMLGCLDHYNDMARRNNLIKSLKPCLNSGDEEVVSHTILTLSRICPEGDEEMLHEFRNRLHSENSRVVKAAATGILNLGNENHLSYLKTSQHSDNIMLTAHINDCGYRLSRKYIRKIELSNADLLNSLEEIFKEDKPVPNFRKSITELVLKYGTEMVMSYTTPYINSASLGPNAIIALGFVGEKADSMTQALLKRTLGLFLNFSPVPPRDKIVSSTIYALTSFCDSSHRTVAENIKRTIVPEKYPSRRVVNSAALGLLTIGNKTDAVALRPYLELPGQEFDTVRQCYEALLEKPEE